MTALSKTNGCAIMSQSPERPAQATLDALGDGGFSVTRKLPLVGDE